MTPSPGDQLAQLLPAIYRLRDGDAGPLHALLATLARQADVVDQDIDRLYENWFIETCDEWVVPYLGDLLGVRGLLPPDRAGWSQRALVANTLGYRQRKGTVPLLEQLVYDITHWAARAVELFRQVAWTQYLDHQQLDQGGTAHLRALRDETLVGSAFDPLAYTPDVRLMSGTRRAPLLEGEKPMAWHGTQLVGVGQSRPNLPNIGLFIWRLKPYRLEKADAAWDAAGHYWFSPLGTDLKLFNHPPGPRSFHQVAAEHELPVALGLLPLADELAARRKALAKNQAPVKQFFGDPPPFEIYLPGTDQALDPKHLRVCDLSDWKCNWTLPADEQDPQGGPKIQAAVDPTLGRIMLAPGLTPGPGLRVSYAYAFSADLGGGPYPPVVGSRVDASAGHRLIANDEALDKALSALSAIGPNVIELAGNGTFAPLTRAKPAAWAVDLGQSLVVQAADGCRPVLKGDLEIRSARPGGELTLSGLLIAGQVRVIGPLGKLTLTDCTLLPGRKPLEIKLPVIGVGHAPEPQPEPQPLPSLDLSRVSSAADVQITRSLLGALIAPHTLGHLTLADSIVDGGEPKTQAGAPLFRLLGRFEIVSPARIRMTQWPALVGSPDGKAPGPAISLQRVTVLGEVHVGEMTLAEDALFTARVTVDTTAEGQLTHCYFPDSSQVPQACFDCVAGTDALEPVFTAREYGMPGYAQLSLACPAEIRAGGTQGAEIGAFHNLHQPQREAELMAQLEEYLRFGLEAGLIYVD